VVAVTFKMGAGAVALALTVVFVGLPPPPADLTVEVTVPAIADDAVTVDAVTSVDDEVAPDSAGDADATDVVVRAAPVALDLLVPPHAAATSTTATSATPIEALLVTTGASP
jgi:hypothetical protein